MPELMGTATVEPRGRFEAGTYQSFTVTYTAGKFGIDDTGSIKLVHRFASDMGKPQFDDPTGANYVSVEASNGAVLHIEYDMKRNIRPWDKTIYIKVVRGFLREKDQIIIRLGDRRSGGPGMRLQSFCEETFEFRILVDCFATYNYVELQKQPEIAIIPGKPKLWKAILPTQRRLRDNFQLAIKCEDAWGNPSDQVDQTLTLKTSHPVIGLPAQVRLSPGEFAVLLKDLSVDLTCDLTVEIYDQAGELLTTANPLRISDETVLLPYWGDLHGQSEETIGTNSARDYFVFARDKAFLDVSAHQGNDFQITNDFWAELNSLTAEFNEDDKFITFPGYEWSGNTGLGGDRNVLYMNEGRAIHRSSHALVDDLSDQDTDAHSAADLFNALKGEDAVAFAHIGGRYADISFAHDINAERSVEIHSAWGTFDWVFEDAMKLGFRVGIVSNSDGHKGRPGASHPGATKFGAYGGLTCMLAPALTRQGIMDALRKRHHYGTTGCRMFLHTQVTFEQPAALFEEDPALGPTETRRVTDAIMGDILSSDEKSITFMVDAVAAAPIERLEIRNRLQLLETVRPYETADLGRRIRVIWEGAEYRGRGRETIWDGKAVLSDNRFENLQPVNRYNIDKKFSQTDAQNVEWEALTTGGHGGFEAILADPKTGTLRIVSEHVEAEISISDIGYEDLVFDAGGLGRRIRLFRLPDDNQHYRLNIERRIKLSAVEDNAIYIRLTQEDGHIVWSSPIYLINPSSEFSKAG
jgi:hypothetical protein